MIKTPRGLRSELGHFNSVTLFFCPQLGVSNYIRNRTESRTDSPSDDSIIFTFLMSSLRPKAAPAATRCPPCDSHSQRDLLNRCARGNIGIWSLTSFRPAPIKPSRFRAATTLLFMWILQQYHHMHTRSTAQAQTLAVRCRLTSWIKNYLVETSSNWNL